MEKRVLIVDQDEATLRRLETVLLTRGFSVSKAHNIHEALQQAIQLRPDLILVEYDLKDGTGIDLLTRFRGIDIQAPVIVMAERASIDLAVETVKRGAEHFIPKPVDLDLLFTVFSRSFERIRAIQREQVRTLERARYERDPFMGKSNAVKELKVLAERLRGANATILIQGETGTGKGVLARWLHQAGPRAKEAFVDLNCAGLSPELLESEIFGHQRGAFTGAVANKIGFLEAADHGILFLDEIGEMDLQVQPKLLKVVEEKRYYRLGDVRERRADVQIVTATHRDLRKMSEAGDFRSDLYFRISTIRLPIPPLRERMEDIPLITDWLLEQMSWEMKCGPLKISESARSALLSYGWPGNIRELRNVLERAVILSEGGVIQSPALDIGRAAERNPPITVESPRTLQEMEKWHILQTLKSENGNVSKTASRLGVSRTTLYAKMQEYKLQERVPFS